MAASLLYPDYEVEFHPYTNCFIFSGMLFIKGFAVDDMRSWHLIRLGV